MYSAMSSTPSEALPGGHIHTQELWYALRGTDAGLESVFLSPNFDGQIIQISPHQKHEEKGGLIFCSYTLLPTDQLRKS